MTDKLNKYKCFIYWGGNCGGIDYEFYSLNQYKQRQYRGRPWNDDPIFLEFKKYNKEAAERFEIYYPEYCINMYDDCIKFD